MKTSLATIRCQNMTWSHCEIVSPTNLVNLSEHRNWEPWTDCKSNKMLDILGIPKISESLGSLGKLGTLEPWEPCGTHRNLRELLEPAGIRNPAETSGTQEPCGTLGFLRRAFEKPILCYSVRIPTASPTLGKTKCRECSLKLGMCVKTQCTLKSINSFLI